MARNITLKAISEESGVPISTVSAILRDDPACYAGKALREKVLSCANRLGYRPNLIARMLRTQRSEMLGFILPNTHTYTGLRYMEEIEKLVRHNGYQLLIGYSLNNAEREENLLNNFRTRFVDGTIILFGDTDKPRSYLKHFMKEEYPIVTIDPPALDVANFSTDYAFGGSLAARYLLELGHTCFTIVASTGENCIPVRLRIEGFRKEILNAGRSLSMVIPPTVHSPTSEEPPSQEALVLSGIRVGKRIFAQTKRPTAIFASNDEIALGIIKAGLRAGLRIPDDISVLGFDGSPASVMAPIPITTIRQPVETIAKKAVETLLTLIKEPSEKTGKKSPHSLLVPPELLLKTSTGPAPHHTPRSRKKQIIEKDSLHRHNMEVKDAEKKLQPCKLS
jgi:DNA-binding LacI/PurR family transcriptional regulator